MNDKMKTYKSEETIKKWQTAILEADKAARSMKDVPDTGSCNMDMLTINFNDWYAKDINKLPLIGDKLTGFWWSGGRVVNIHIEGQANRRNAMVEAANKVLREHGINSAVYYTNSTNTLKTN